MNADTPNGAPAEAAAGPSSAAPEAGDVAAVLAQKDAELAELRTRMLYVQAESENVRKRTEKRYRDALEYATEPLLRDLLPVLDSLETAEAHAGGCDPETRDAVVEGLGHVILQFRQVLGRHGVEEVPALGERFDPHVHEALTQVPGAEANRVAEVFQKGYLLKGRLLRPAKVAVSRLAAPAADG